MDQTTSSAAPADASARELIIADIRKQQNLMLAVAGGLGTAIAAAIGWAVITVVTQMELGIVAIAVGYAVGRVIRELGKGIDPVFGYVGAALALFGCVLGNFLSAVGFYAQSQHIEFGQAFASLDAGMAQRLMQAFFSPMDLIFYGIAIYEGYRFSFKYRAH